MAQRQALVWPPVYGAANRRIKGFYPSVVLRDGIVPLLDNIELQKANSQATRISIRAIVPKSVLGEIREFVAVAGVNIEAIFPINHVLSDCFVVYFSFNKPERVAHMYQSTDSTTTITQIPTEELERRTSDYRIVRLTDMTIKISEQIAELFLSMFSSYPVDISASAIRRMPEDHIVMAAYGGKELVSVFMADIAQCFLDRSVSLNFFDFVNVVSVTDGLLLVPLMARRVIDITKTYVNPIIYAEARADIPGLQVCCARAGMIKSGTLVASSLFRDHGEKEAEFRDTVVWYVPHT
ncbi:MAG: hypothetical protein Q7S22_04390 [Candidatus Micrarchaeota archaeon]|nr:hypothetical protein [Candidatus Micrarchaeota archaeon]